MTTGGRFPILACVAVLVLGATVTPWVRGDYGHSRVYAQRATTFSQDVAPILFDACVSCHRPDGSAPFSLLTYQEARPWARSIKLRVLLRDMPPWQPEPGYGNFVGERRLSDEELATIQAWVDGGAPEGDPALLPDAPTLTGRWQLGEPDLVIETPAYALRAGGEDMYRNFVIPIPLSGTRYIKAWEFLPGNPRVVHHATMEFDPTGVSRQRDAEDPQPGYEGLIPHSVQKPDGYFLDWGPGHMPYVAPDGMAWPLYPNNDLVVMMHLRPDGQPETVQATLGLYFSDHPPSQTPTLIRLTRQHLDIPPEEKQYRVTDSFELGVDVDVHTVQPHAHYLAKEVKGFATLPSGAREWLIYIRDWDFDWQGVYRYDTAVYLPAGTTITMEWVYDNSAANPNNPHVPPTRVTYGQRTSDEMSELWLQVVPRDPRDKSELTRAVHMKVLHEEIVGHEKMLEANPTDVALHDDVALLYAEVGNLERTAEHFAQTLRLRPDSPAAHYNLGTVRLMQRRLDEASEYFRTAVALRPDYALAYDGLGLALQTVGQTGEALDNFHQAVQFAPGNASLRYHLAALLRGLGRLREAAEHYRQVLALDPTLVRVRAELDDLERQLARLPVPPN